MSIALIGGTGRSGTSILTKVFARHPDVCDVPEWRFLVDPDGILDFYATSDVWTPYVYDRRLKRLRRLLQKVTRRHPLWILFEGLHRWDLLKASPRNIRPYYAGISTLDVCPDFERLVDTLMNELTQFTFRGYWVGMRAGEPNRLLYGCFADRRALAPVFGRFLRDVIDSVLVQQGAAHYLEKNTWNILWFDRILELLPEAKMVHIFRDPRDVVSSFVRQSWMPSEPREAAVIYRDLMDRWWDIRSRIPGASYLELSLESLVGDPRGTIERVCDFWGIPWHDALLQTDLSRSHSGRWKKDLNSRQQQEVHDVLAEQIIAHGYV